MRITSVVFGILMTPVIHATLSYGLPASWSSPDIDSWTYENAGSPGFGPWASTFSGGYDIDPNTSQFQPRSADDMNRFSAVLLGYETSDQITAGLDPSRYDVQSVSVTVMYRSGFTGFSKYETAQIDPSQYLADYLGGGVVPQLPMEMYGVGFRDGYEGLALGVNQTGTRYSELTHPASGGPTLVGHPDLETSYSYVAYPKVGDPNQPGEWIDVSNSMSGGFSETAPGNLTDPFSPTPWAIGTASLNVGDDIPLNTTFTFDIDLSQPGVASYVQQSLADGALGFFLSTLHVTTLFGDTGPIARWHTKEAVSGAAEPAALSIEYSILPPTPDPDFNLDGNVDGLDFLTWQRDPNSYGGAAGLSAWEGQYGSGVADSVNAVPEAATAVMALTGLIGIVRLGARRR